MARPREQEEEHDLSLARRLLPRVEVPRVGLELRRLDQPLDLLDLLRDPEPPAVDVGGRLHIAYARKARQQAQHLRETGTQHIRGPRGPQQVLDQSEAGKAEEDADQTVPKDGGAGRGAEAVENGLVEREARLVAAVGDARRSEVRPG